VVTEVPVSPQHLLSEQAVLALYAGLMHRLTAFMLLLPCSGVPLLEIVSEPDMRCAKDAAAYGAELRRICRFLGISDGNMAEGSMRCDVNVSVRPKGTEAFGTKVEVKNMNSFSNMQKAIEFEIERQVRGAHEPMQHRACSITGLAVPARRTCRASI